MVLRLLASALALILTFGSTGVYAATTTGYKNDDVKLTATRDEESNNIAVTLYADREMYEPFFSFIYSAAAETNNATFDSYTANMNIFNSNNSNPQRMVHLMNGGHSPQKDDELFSIIYKIDGEFEADKDYTFLVQFDEAFDGNFEYYKWSADAMEVTYRENTVSFDLNGGDSAAIPDQIVVSGDKATKPENPTREGYTFKYWTKDGAEFDFSTPITEKTQLVAEWEEDAKTYTLDYNMNGGTNGPEDETKESKDNSVDFTVSNVKPEKNTYDFLGWADTNDATEATYQAGATITVTSNDANLTKTIYAVWKLKEYTVTWKNEDGTVLETDENVPYGSTPSYDGQTPAKAATEEKTYEFDGWTPEIANVTGDVTYTAKYKETTNTYTVTWKNEDGTVLETDENVPYGTTPTYDGETPAKATTAEKTYTFAGWTPEVKAVTGDVTYTATFTEQDIPKTNYTVTFDSDGGTSVAAQTVEEGQTATRTADPTKDNNVFAGWKLDGNDYDFSSPVTGNITLVASWTEKEEPQPAEKDEYTVNTTTADHTYQIFQIFTGDLSSKTVEEDGKQVTKDILTNLVWGENGTGSKGDVVPENVIKALNGVVGETLDKTKLAEIEKYVNTDGTPVKVITTSGTASVDIPAGYYLIRDLPDSQDGKDDAYTTYITVVVKDYTVKPKSAKPTVDKKVAGGETADYAINETFQFTLTASLPADTDFAAYKKYKLTFTDTMSSGITFEQIDSVTVDGKTIDSTKYVSTATEGKKGGDWTLTIEDIKTAASGVDITDGCDVVVTYSAHLNEGAVAHSIGGDITADNANTNSAKLTYSNNPNTDGDGDTGETTTDDKVWVFTYKVDNTKVGETNGTQSPLKDAGFKLYSEDGNTEIPLAYDSANKVYYPAEAGTTGVEMKSAEDGTFNIKGLDAGTYTLKETTTPDGYNTCDDTKVKISASHQEDSSGTKATLTFSQDSTVNNTIVNKSGSELPHTGGIGTTIFYVIGGILVIGAGIVLITRRRMGAE